MLLDDVARLLERPGGRFLQEARHLALDLLAALHLGFEAMFQRGDLVPRVGELGVLGAIAAATAPDAGRAARGGRRRGWRHGDRGGAARRGSSGAAVPLARAMELGLDGGDLAIARGQLRLEFLHACAVRA